MLKKIVIGADHLGKNLKDKIKMEQKLKELESDQIECAEFEFLGGGERFFGNSDVNNARLLSILET